MWQTSHAVILMAALLADDSGSTPTPDPAPNAAVSVSLNAANWDIAYSRIRCFKVPNWGQVGKLHALASLIHRRMSAFAVAIGGKADVPFCTAYVR
jgi:hypothetical protein